MQRDIDSFNAEKTNDKTLIERGIDVSEDAEGNLFMTPKNHYLKHLLMINGSCLNFNVSKK